MGTLSWKGIYCGWIPVQYCNPHITSDHSMKCWLKHCGIICVAYGFNAHCTILFEICSSWMFQPLNVRPLHCLKTSGIQWYSVTSQKNRNLVISILKMLEFTFNSFFKWFIHYVWFCCDLYITLHSYNTQATPVLKLSSALYYYWDWCIVSSELVSWTFLYRMGLKIDLWYAYCP